VSKDEIYQIIIKIAENASLLLEMPFVSLSEENLDDFISSLKEIDNALDNALSFWE
jgi:hypothetical protein